MLLFGGWLTTRLSSVDRSSPPRGRPCSRLGHRHLDGRFCEGIERTRDVPSYVETHTFRPASRSACLSPSASASSRSRSSRRRSRPPARQGRAVLLVFRCYLDEHPLSRVPLVQLPCRMEEAGPISYGCRELETPHQPSPELSEGPVGLLCLLDVCLYGYVGARSRAL